MFFTCCGLREKMVYFLLGILGEMGLRWDIGWGLGKFERHWAICQGIKGILGVVEGWGGRLVGIMWLFLRWINGSGFSYYFLSQSSFFFLNILIFLALSILLSYRPLSFSLPDRTGRQGIADFEKTYLTKGKQNDVESNYFLGQTQKFFVLMNPYSPCSLFSILVYPCSFFIFYWT